LNKIFIENSFKSKPKIMGEFGPALGVFLESPQAQAN
jgi:hypothetical protein